MGKAKGSGPPGNEGTVFLPDGGPTLPSGGRKKGRVSDDAAARQKEEAAPRASRATAPGAPAPPPPPEEPTQWTPAGPARAVADATAWKAAPPGTGFAPRAPTGGIQVGDVLNHIFAVTRFIARGGMGEVFEGCNVNSDERVAIKVMLPSLAQDENVISMFRKEARTLTRLQHEALVQYRVLAQEPQLGVLYIVTEYIDGVNLADVLGTIGATPADLEALLRRLAAGLRAAHALGAIHRDMSPDNVLLEGGRLSGAKIVDFGIAKDLDPGSATIVGDGFAGKLNYVAPEQLGDFGRAMGPWTDVYSLGLVILALSGGRNVQMGGSLVDAVDKRRAGPDLTAAPERLRPVLARMLAPDPAARLQSMDAVLAALDGEPPAAPAAARNGAGKHAPDAGAAAPRRTLLLAGGGAAAALLAITAAFFVLRAGEGARPPNEHGSAPAPSAAVPASRGDAAEVARAAINGAMPAVECSWLDITDLHRDGDRLSVRLTGVAGNPPSAQNDVSNALSSAGLAAVDIDFSEVAQIEPAGCSALDAYRQIRAGDGGRLSVPQRTFEIGPVEDEGNARASKALITLSIGNPGEDLALAGIDPSGEIDPLIVGRAALQDALSHRQIDSIGEDRYRLTSLLDHTGWSGVLLITGHGPFDRALIAPAPPGRGADWKRRFLDMARARGWKAEMVWFKSVDERPG